MSTLLASGLQSSAVEKWFAKGPSVVAFDDRLQYYFKTMEEVQSVALVKDQESIRLHMEPLAAAIKTHAKEWVKCYGNVLHDSAKTALFSLKHDLEVSIEHGPEAVLSAFSKSLWESQDVVAYVKLVNAGHFSCHIRHHVLAMFEKSDIMSDKVSHKTSPHRTFLISCQTCPAWPAYFENTKLL